VSDLPFASFVSACVFDMAAFTHERLVETKRALTFQTQVGLASTDCEVSSGRMRLVVAKQVKRMCWYANDYLRLLRIIPREFHSVNFVLCDKDCLEPDRRFLAVTKSRPITAPKNRTASVVPVNVGRHFMHVRRAIYEKLKFEHKIPIAVWRGTSTSFCWDQGPIVDRVRNIPECARWSLVTRWSSSNVSVIDVGISRVVQLSPKLQQAYAPYVKPALTVDELLKFKYIVSVQGNDVATNLKWALASNSVVLMPPPTRESFILESNLKPWIHYVPLKYDTSDLAEKVMYCELNEEKCKQISQAATAWMRNFSSRWRLFRLGATVLQAHLKIMQDLERHAL